MLHVSVFLTADSLGKSQAAAEVAASSSCLLDLAVAEATGSIPSHHSDLLIASACVAASSGQLFHCCDPPTQNGEDNSTESDDIPVERLSMSDSGALVTLNGGVQQNESIAHANYLPRDNVADLLSNIDDALNSYIDASSAAV